MQTIKLYCPSCKKHTPHMNMPQVYATYCTKCHTHTPSIMRSQAAFASSVPIIAPDGSPVEIVENSPSLVTYYIAEGENAGYYDYEKGTGKRTIRK